MKNRRGVVFPLLLIVVGAVWLLQSIGVLSPDSWWQLTRLWPVLLIAIGLQIVFGTSRAGRLMVVAVTLGLVVGGLFMLNGGMFAGGDGAGGSGVGADTGAGSSGDEDGGGDSLESIDVPLDGAVSGEIRLGPGIARLDVRAGQAGDALVAGNISHPRRYDPPSLRVETDADEHMTVRIDERERRSFSFWPFGIDGDFRWDLQLSPDVPIALDVDAGVGEIKLDLRGLMLSGLDLDVGVGSVTVHLPDSGNYEVDIDGGVGSIVLIIPEGVEASVDADIGIGGVSVPDGFSAFGDERWSTEGFEDASDRADIRIDGGVGNITVRVDE